MHCKSYSHFFSKKFQHICISLDVNFNESLTNDVVSFEQLGPGLLNLFALVLLNDSVDIDQTTYSATSNLCLHCFPTSVGLIYPKYLDTLTLKMPRKPASENVVCFCCLLNILANSSNLFLHTGKQCGSKFRLLLEEQPDLGLRCLQKWLLKSQADDKADDSCCD